MHSLGFHASCRHTMTRILNIIFILNTFKSLQLPHLPCSQRVTQKKADEVSDGTSDPNSAPSEHLCLPPAPTKAGLTQLWRSWQVQWSDAHECNLMNSFLSGSSMRVKPIPSGETSNCYVLCSPHPTSLAAPWKIPFPRALSAWLPPQNSRTVHAEDRTPAHPPCAETAETFIFSVQSTLWQCSGTSHERLSLSLGETGNRNNWVHLYIR